MEQSKLKGLTKAFMAIAVLSLSSPVNAGEKEELLKLKNTTTNLIKLLVKQGVLSKDNAEQMIRQAELDAEKQVQQQMQQNKVAEVVEKDVVRVPYVPEFVRDQIRQQVRADLRADVLSDVMKEAKTKQWGIPNALPGWTRRFKLYGDMRLRYDHDHFARNNFQNPQVADVNSVNDYLAINEKGGLTAAGAKGLKNINEDRDRFRTRLRLGINAKITQGLDAGIRLTSGNVRNPLSTNQTMGNSGNKYTFVIDRAFLRYNALDSDGYNWLTLQGGRIVNPFYATDLVWDRDLSFEGFAATGRYNLAGSGSLYEQEDQSKTLFLTVGAFPLQEFQLSSKDKWLLGGQLGTEWEMTNQDKFKFGVSYYHYLNVEAHPAALGKLSHACSNPDNDRDASIPEFMQYGNSMVPVCYAAFNSNNSPEKFGLASKYQIFNVTASYDWAMFAPIHAKLTLDYAKNLGFDRNDIRRRVGNDAVIYRNKNLDDRTTAWQVRLDLGWTKTLLPGKWNTYLAYKYIEADAVLDAFNDSNFHLGGTNAKGWVIQANYGLMENAWLSARWISTDQIDGPKIGSDVLLVDFNAKF